MLVRLLANDLVEDGIYVAAIHPGWGRDAQGLPQRHGQPRIAAAVLRETITKLGDEQRGRLVDLYGARSPDG
jgi:NAD(P)-dependent dehydrogenase (short-subunit alcohol dehydrogenase family)